MAGDATIQGYIRTLIQASSTFADADVTLGDTRVVGNPGGPWAIILPGALRARRGGDWSQVLYFWDHPVEVWARFAGDDYSGLSTAVMAVCDAIGANPTLGGQSKIDDSLVTSASGPIWLMLKGQQPGTLPQRVGMRLVVSTVEERLYSGSGEFA